MAATIPLPSCPSRRRHCWSGEPPCRGTRTTLRISRAFRRNIRWFTAYCLQVRGAAEGAGLGNAFLSNIQSVDGIFHVVRAFESEEVIHVDDTVDPIRDLDTIQLELSKKDLTFVEAAEAKETKDVKCSPGTKLSLTFTDTIKKCKDLLVPSPSLLLSPHAHVPMLHPGVMRQAGRQHSRSRWRFFNS